MNIPNSRWFIEAYIGLYILAPMINRFIEKSTHRELGIFILAFYLFSTLFGYLGKAYDFNKGMSIISLVGLYLIGAYLRRKQEQGYGFENDKGVEVAIRGNRESCFQDEGGDGYHNESGNEVNT